MVKVKSPASPAYEPEEPERTEAAYSSPKELLASLPQVSDRFFTHPRNYSSRLTVSCVSGNERYTLEIGRTGWWGTTFDYRAWAYDSTGKRVPLSGSLYPLIRKAEGQNADDGRKTVRNLLEEALQKLAA